MLLFLLDVLNGTKKIDEPAKDPITGFGNVAYTLHFYAATHKQWLRDAGTAALAQCIPIFASEIGGMESSGDGAIDNAEWNSWISWLKENDISWAAWSISNKAETCSMIRPTSSANAPWTDAQLNEWGVLVRNLLIAIA